MNRLTSLGMILGTMFTAIYLVSSAVPSAVAPLMAHGAALGATPLAGLLLRSPRG